MEYRLNILGSLHYLTDQYSVNNWDIDNLAAVLNSIGVIDYSEDDLTYWLEQLNRR